MRDAISGAPVCACGAVYLVPPLLRAPVDTAARAAGWRIFTGRTYGGTHLDDAQCPACQNTAPDVPAATSTEQEPLPMHFPRTTAVRVGIVALLAGLATLLVGAAAFGSPGGNDPSIGQIKVVEPCAAAQAHANDGRGALGEHGDAVYRCKETSPGCYQWKWVYDGRPKTGKSWSRPPCPQCSPSPSKPAAGLSPSRSATPGQSTTSSTPPVDTPAPDTTPVGNILPVTGLPTVVIGAAAVGVLLVLAGAVLLAFSLRRPNP